MIYTPLAGQDDYHKAYTITDNNNVEIGYVDGHLTHNGDLVFGIKIFDSEKQGTGLGFAAFSKIYEELNQTLPIKVIKGSWHSGEEFESCEEGMSTNLKVFLDERQNGKSDEEAAFETPTGKWAQRLGYNQCNIISISREETLVDFIRNNDEN